MDQEQPHEKIKFRRDEIADLSAMPSACVVPPLGKARLRRGRRILFRLVVAFALLLAVLAGSVYLIGASGIGSERLRSIAERAIERMAGVDVSVALGPARLTLDGGSFLALRVSDVSVRTAAGRPMVEAGSMRFGVRLIPLLSGDVRLTSARIVDARIVAADFPSGTGDWSASLRNAEGLIDPDKVLAAVFGGLRQALDAVRTDSVRRVGLRNVDIVLPETGDVKLLHIANGRLAETGPEAIELSLDADIDGLGLTATAAASRDGGGRIGALEADIAMAAPPSGKDTAAAGSLGRLAVHLTGAEGQGPAPSRLSASVSIADAALDLEDEGVVPLDADVSATLTAGANKLSLDRVQIRSGRSTFDFEGSLGPKPRDAGDREPSYRYDLVSDGSTLAPGDSPEPALPFLARVAGTYQTVSKKLVADTIALRAGPTGEVRGSVIVAFAPGKKPGLSVAFGVHDMPVSQVKQLWPWFSAKGARSWVLNNLFGGRVLNGNVSFSKTPQDAETGDDQPPDEEVSGRFEIENTRFDTAGRIPPVRDASGAVEFHGTNVRITLSSGTVFLPSGRTVAASDGSLTVDDVKVHPVIGSLDIDVAGEAPAIAELASYEPIDAMSHVGIMPSDLSGTVTGNVKADVPLESGADKDSLSWLVALDYKDLSLAKPFDGQTVTAADGNITVDPAKAVISATGKLNGIPAEINLVEPLRQDGLSRSRKVSLIIDDKTREAFMPGLSTLLSGTIKVAVDRNDDGSQAVSADLTNARLTIPWAGWSKGVGVPADVSFIMTGDGTAKTLSHFDLSGKSFGIEGRVQLDGDDLASATFDKVRLNRGDDVSVTVKRSSRNYAVTIRGDALDARSLIKQFTSDSDTAAKAAGSGSVSVDADVKSLTGFHDEQLSDLKLDYAVGGSRTGGLKASATARSGAAITIADTSAGGKRSLSMKSSDAGAVLRFLDVYEHMQGGAMTLALSSQGNGPLQGSLDARNFMVVDEPKLASIVSTTPVGDSRSLDQAVKGKIDTSRVPFDRAFAEIEKGDGYLNLAKGIVRGPSIGTTFQGTLYDRNNNMDVTGTFMPIYGLNRIFGQLPIVGALLGNGRDGGLIGVTYRLRGSTDNPVLTVNPLSVIAPGIFRSIFEFR